MVPFKNIFLGRAAADFSRVCTAQRCLRAGGKHNDLENVGYTARHHTLFEMLGNFSFGDYFKADAIRWAWQFLTDEHPTGLGLNPRQLWITVFGGGDPWGNGQQSLPADLDSMQYWRQCLTQAGFSERELEQRITPVSTMDNFWMMGDVGPCGPCSEIFYDHDKNADRFCGFEQQNADRCIEIWNLVFMQYSRSSDGSLAALPAPCVDTGMGLERIAAVVQGVDSNYRIDLFEKLLAAVDRVVSSGGGTRCGNHFLPSHHVIADHLRAAVFLLAEGIRPGNEGQNYVLRRIIRRAARHAWKLGLEQGCLHALVADLAQAMDLETDTDSDSLNKDLQRQIAADLLAEEQQFAATLKKGMQMLEQVMQDAAPGTAIAGAVIFQLYDTYGFPADMSADILRERGLHADMAEFDQLMSEQRSRARQHSNFSAVPTASLLAEAGDSQTSNFCGFKQLSTDTKITGIWHDGKQSQQLSPGQQGLITLRTTPFYAQGGGQVGDRGVLLQNGVAAFEIDDTRLEGGFHLHSGTALQQLAVDTEVSAEVDSTLRLNTARNHSATHLLHAALREILGEHVQQRGSLVDADRLRFDFSQPKALTGLQCEQLERRVNEQILANSPVIVEEMSTFDAAKKGALALFGEKYGDRVRVLSMGGNAELPFSVELCGGTHVNFSGDIGSFYIVREQSVSAGVRRIEAITGQASLLENLQNRKQLTEMAELLDCRRRQLPERFEQLLADHRNNLSMINKLQRKPAVATDIDRLIDKAIIFDNTKVLCEMLQESDQNALRQTIDRARQRLGSAVIFLACSDNDRLSLACGVTPDISPRLSAAVVMQEFAARLGGKGGGKKDFARGGGKDIAAWPAVSEALVQWVGEQLQR